MIGEYMRSTACHSYFLLIGAIHLPCVLCGSHSNL